MPSYMSVAFRGKMIPLKGEALKKFIDQPEYQNVSKYD
jgi:hypothetical protein